MLLLGCASRSAPPAFATLVPPVGPPATAPRMRAASGEPAGFALGINEAVAVPAKQRAQLSDDALQAALDADAVAVRGVGARYVRGHTGNFPGVACSELAQRPQLRDELDAWVRALGTDLIGVAMVSPWPANQSGNFTETYVPIDLAAYQRCVAALVERYDGDGVDDMPGLAAPLRYWEVDNEPDLKNSNIPAHPRRTYDPKTFCRPEEYAIVLRATASAIRRADPEAKILALGLYRPHAEQGREYGRNVLEQPGVIESVDILSLHTYADDDGETLARGVAYFRSLVPDKPIWVTEASVTLHDGTAGEQGRRVAAYVAGAASAGAERLFWHTLADPPAGKDTSQLPFATSSLLRATTEGPPVDKAAGTVFRNLALRLAADDLTGAVADGDGAVRARSGAVLLFRGDRIAVNGGVDLASGLAVAPGGVVAAPGWIFPG